MGEGLVHVCYGDGPGKTTAAVGLAARARGAGYKVLFAQFLKNGRSSELTGLQALGVEVLEGKPCEKFFPFMNDTEKAQANTEQRDTFLASKEKAYSGEYRLVVLDEVIDIVTLGIITPAELLDFLRSKPETLEIALTGHSAIPELIEAADYVSEVKKVKHPYDQGVKARRGIEW